MKICLLSDIHREVARPKIKIPQDTDVVVLAGDISKGSEGIRWAQDYFSIPVIYVAGNHEFWGKKRTHTEHIENMRKLSKDSNVHFLEDDTTIVNGVRFIGATLWCDFNLFGDIEGGMEDAVIHLNDYNNMYTGSNRLVTPNYLARVHEVSKAYIDAELAKPYDGHTVVVTHHAPSAQSLSSYHHRHMYISPAYASNLESLIAKHKPHLWMHGHIHSSMDYMLGDTRVICNPHGYKDVKLNPNFDPNLIILT